MLNTLLAITLILVSFLVALAVLFAFGMMDHRKTSRLRSFSQDERDTIVFIFENETLLDATPAARQLLESADRSGSSWSHLTTILAPRFPRLTEWIKDLAEVGQMEVGANDGSSHLKAEWHDGVARISLISNHESANQTIDSHSLSAMNHELESLRANAERSPSPLWREDRQGTITWCNRAYLELADTVDSSDEMRPWPPARIFALTESSLIKPAGDAQPAIHRIAVNPEGTETRRWFEVTEIPLEEGGALYSASSADKLVRTETSLKEFVTTLTKTFASLPIGLAIFNRDRELALFNPALMDLTALHVEFLIGKPKLSSFLDKLREARMIPEPKDYKSWRQQMSDLVAAAQNGTYEETWSLPTGQTYRVTGQPHPDGAVALLFEDITAEISLTRRFRSELEIGQATLDALPQAIAVFGDNGALSISNRAYADLWGDDPSTMVGEITIADLVRHWQEKCAPSPMWEQIRATVGHPFSAREGWQGRVTLLDGRSILARITPLARGATMVDFSLAQQTQLTAPQDGRLEPVTSNDPLLTAEA